MEREVEKKEFRRCLVAVWFFLLLRLMQGLVLVFTAPYATLSYSPLSISHKSFCVFVSQWLINQKVVKKTSSFFLVFPIIFLLRLE